MIFVDGVGIGKRDPSVNPFFKYGFKTFEELLGDVPSLENPTLNKGDIHLFPVDALLGVDKIPQSGTGQVSIFCGVNAPNLLGYHWGPFPPTSLLPIIEEKNLFKEFQLLGKQTAFTNAYPKVFFDYLKSGKKRISATSLSCLLSGIKLNGPKELRAGKAVSAEIDNSRWVNRLKYKLPIITPELAAKRLLKIAYNNTFTLYEYYLTDHLGHGRHAEYMSEWFGTLDRFLYYVLKNFDRDKLMVVICSDHGNLEDISIKMHTLNPALTITAGIKSGELSSKIKDLSDIKPSILELFK